MVYLRITVAFFLGLTVSACVAPIPPEQRVIVTAGVKLVDYKKTLFGNAKFGSAGFYFQEYNPASGELTGIDRMIFLSGGCGPECKSWAEMNYFQGNGRSGHYILRGFQTTYSYGGVYNIDYFDFVKSKRTLLGLDHTPDYSASIKGLSLLKYHFVAGQTAYLGDFTFDLTAKTAIAVAHVRNDAAALRALSAKDSMISALVYKALTRSDPQGDVSVSRDDISEILDPKTGAFVLR